MDAIPSLCASTASCGAAAVGFTYGRKTDFTTDNETERTHGDTVDPTTPVATHTAYSTPQHRPVRASTAARPQSAALPRVSSWAVFRRTSLDEREGPASHNTQSTNIETESGDNPVTLIEGSEGRLEIRPRTSWVRRVSTIAQSRDGSSPSTPRPGTPSLFSNGSSAPLFGTAQTPTPRNRLVKRSTSQRVLHSATYAGSSLSTPQAPTFRRPATSHQRSEQLKLQTLQQVYETPNKPQNRPIDDQRNSPEPIPPGVATDLLLKPYFEVTSIRIPSDTARSRRSTSVARIRSLSTNARHSETVRCVKHPTGQVPVLVKCFEVERYSRYASEPLPLATEFATPLPHATEVQSTPSTSQRSDQVVRPRASFSIGDLMATPSPPWKLRGGSLRRKKGREPINAGRRVASAPHKAMTDMDSGEEKQDGETVSDARGRVVSVQHKKVSPFQSSPLPPLHRLSAFEIEIPSEVSIGPSSPVASLPTSPAMQDGTDAHPNTADSSFVSKNFRSSRIPSDRESTVFSSDNEHSRVFSADGDDADYRSETVFDSIRTDTTNNSHSGAKAHRLEAVFKDPTTPDLAKHNLTVLQEKLERASLSSDDARHDFIAEEDENVVTPVQSRQGMRERNVSPQRPITASRMQVPSSPPTLPTPTRQAATYPQNVELEPDWSGDDGDDESEDFRAVKPSNPISSSQNEPVLPPHDTNFELSERTKAKLLQWSEVRNAKDSESLAGSSPRPRTSAAQVKEQERGSRSTNRRGTTSFHLRSQSVPLPPENNNQRFLNNAAKLEAWILRGQGESEDWDSDFVFDETIETVEDDSGGSGKVSKPLETSGVLVPPSIIEKQASVHGQFGQVKELSLLVEELRRLRQSGETNGILQGQAVSLWKEADGIIDLVTLNEAEPNLSAPHSPTSASFDFDSFDDDSTSHRRRRSSASPQVEAPYEGPASARPSPAGSRFDIPTGRARKESIAKVKNVLETIHSRRKSLEPVPDTETSPKKDPFDTTSLRDLLTRAGVLTRALKEIVRKTENPDSTPETPERGSATPPDPPFSQIFQQPSSPSSSRKSPRVARRKSSSSFLTAPAPANDNNEINGHMKIMTVA